MSEQTSKTNLTADAVVGDRDFFRQVSQLREFKRFLADELVAVDTAQLPNINLAALNFISFRHSGRSPTPEEWLLVDEKRAALIALITMPMRRRIRLYRVRWYFRSLPIILLAVAVVSLIVQIYLLTAPNAASTTTGTSLANSLKLLGLVTMPLLWTLSLAGLGACGFLGTTFITQSGDSPERDADDKEALSEEESIDITDSELITTRLVVGVLFAFLLTLPFAQSSMTALATTLFPNVPSTLTAGDIPMLLAPFILGFSTTLILGVMDRFVTTLRTFFGLSDGKPASS